MNAKKIKAVFEIFLVVSLIFIFGLSNAQPAYSQEDNRVCCQKAIIDGEETYCQYTEESNCDPSGGSWDNLCEDVSVCKPVCCNLNDLGYSATGGQGCFKNVGSDYCKNTLGGTIVSDANCNVPECNRGCCRIGSQCTLSTEQGCQDLTGTYPDLELNYNADINNEIQCADVCRAEKRGCCVTGENNQNNCNLITFNECTSQGGDFYEGISCVNVPNNKCKECGTLQEARRAGRTGCADDITTGEDVYYYDKCGNPIIDEALADDCDYSEGTLCRENLDNKTATCADLNCKEVWDNPHVNENFDSGNKLTDDDGNFGVNKNRDERINGESWCEFDADAGPTRDLPGTRHYVHTCYEGEEQVQECRDFREEFCFQFVGLNMDVAKCLPNRAIENPCGACSEDANPKECCENTNLRDCVWLAADKEEARKQGEDARRTAESNNYTIETRDVDENKDGVCIPLVPPGTKYWEGDDSLCQYGSKEGDNALKVYWHNAGWGTDWDCDSGCEVYTQKFAYGQNKMCKAQADCGANYNLAGKWSGSGFVRTCDVASKISNDYGWGEVKDQKGVEEYGNNGDKVYGDNGADDLVENCLEELPDPVGKTDEDKYSFEDLIDYSNSLKIDLPPEANYPGWWVSGGKGGITGADAVVLSSSLGIGLGVYLAINIAVHYGWITIAAGASAVPVVGWITAIVIVVVLAISLGTGGSSTEKVEVSCKAWAPPINSNDCSLCHSPGERTYLTEDGTMSNPESIDLTAGGLHQCTEYLCKSLGQNCEFFPETEEGPKCLNSCENPRDVNSPVISPLSNLASKNPLKCRDGSDPASGHEEDCRASGQRLHSGYDLKYIKENTDVVVGVETNELAVCKWDFEGKPYDDMGSFDQVTAAKNHTTTLKADIDIIPGDKKSMYVICKDLCDNPQGVGVPYEIDLEVSEARDLGAPVFVSLTPSSGSPVKHDLENNATITSLRLNEPAYCKWSRTNDAYDTMPNLFNCRSSYARGCDFVLTNLNQGVNTFFIRCQDISGNSNADSMPDNNGYTLIRSDTLQIAEIKCKNSLNNDCSPIYDSNFTLELSTFGGGYQGKAVCLYSGIEFFNTNTSVHSQVVGPLSSGSYTLPVTCIDDADNVASAAVNYTIIKDENPPKILKIFKQADNLVILTDETASCRYSDSKDLIYNEMSPFDSTDNTIHATSIADKDYVHVKCLDRFSHVTSLDIYISKMNI